MLAPHPALPIIVFTGLDDEDVALAAVKAGAQDYLVKGRFDEFLLRRSIRHALERQRAETALHESEERYRTLFNEMPVGVYRTSEDGRIQVSNPALAALLGVGSPADLLGHDVREFYVEPEERERWRQMVEQEGVLHDAEIQLRCKDGTLIWVRDSGRAVRDEAGRVTHFEGTLSDITKRKRAEEQLQAMSLRNEAMLGAVPDIVMEVDANKVYAWANRAGIEFFGEGAIGKEAAFYFEGEQETYDLVQPLFDGKEETFYVESWQRRQDGEKRLLGWWCRVLKDADEKVIGALSTARDFTERNRAEVELRESEERYRKLVEFSPDSIGIHCEGKVAYVNSAAVKLFHANRPDDLIGLPVIQLIHPDYRAIAMERVRQSYENSLPAPLMEEAIVTLDGQYVDVEISATPILHEGKPATQIVIRDITERKAAEDSAARVGGQLPQHLRRDPGRNHGPGAQWRIPRRQSARLRDVRLHSPGVPGQDRSRPCPARWRASAR